MAGVGSALVLAAVVIGFVMAIKPPDARSGEVTASALKPRLAGGGLSTDDIGGYLALESFRAHGEGPMYKVIEDGVSDGVISEFRQMPASTKRMRVFTLNNGAVRMRFSRKSGFSTKYKPRGRRYQPKLDKIMRHYGYFTAEDRSRLDDLLGQTNDLQSDISDRSLTAGKPEPDLNARAKTLAGKLRAWQRQSGHDTPQEKRVNAAINNVDAAATLTASPSQEKVDKYNETVKKYNKTLKSN